MQCCSKLKELRKWIGQYMQGDIIVAFSGGADSSLLLKICCELAAESGVKVYAVTACTMLHPAQDMEIAAQVAKEMGAVHKILFVDELEEAGILNNPKDRCYRCKKCIFIKMRNFAETLGIHTLFEGTNEDDMHVYRPGIKAVRELGILSPLAAVHVTKEEIRQMAAAYGISVADRPASPCLATRFPYGTILDEQAMRRVEQAEKYLRGLGFYNVRVRVHTTGGDSRDWTGSVARIEVDEFELQKALTHKESILQHFLALGFQYVTLDLSGFHSGSMDTGGQIS